MAISPADTLQMLLICGVTIVCLAFFWKDFLVLFFDEMHAQSIGQNTKLLKILFFTLLSACTVAALQTVGAFLVIAMIIILGVMGVRPGRNRRRGAATEAPGAKKKQSKKKKKRKEK